MALYIWDENYSIGIAEIDQQHKDVFGTIHALHGAVRAGRSGEQIEPALIKLIALSRKHFDTEEALMAFHGFPDLNNHSAEHRLIAAQLELFLQDQRAAKPGLIIELLEYAEDWQGIHVLQHDMKYRDYLLQQWGIQFKRQTASSVAVPRRSVEERRYERFACSIPVELRASGDGATVFAKCVNLSQLGAFLRTWSPLKVNTTATARFQIAEEMTEDVRICARRSESGIGMGVSFLGPMPRRLQEYLSFLGQGQASGQERPTATTCERLLHDCMLNLTALEDVISETDINQDTAEAVRSLLSHTRRLERMTEKHRPIS